jgi:hypothetical protein
VGVLRSGYYLHAVLYAYALSHFESVRRRSEFTLVMLTMSSYLAWRVRVGV